MWITEDETEILLEVMEIWRDGRLLVKSKMGGPFIVYPENPDAVILLIDESDDKNRIRAMQSLGYEFIPFEPYD